MTYENLPDRFTVDSHTLALDRGLAGFFLKDFLYVPVIKKLLPETGIIPLANPSVHLAIIRGYADYSRRRR